MKSEEIDALETIFGDMSRDDIESVADGLRDMDEQAKAESEPEEVNPNTIMAKLMASVPLPESFKFKDKKTFYTMLRNIYRKEWILTTGPSGCGK